MHLWHISSELLEDEKQMKALDGVVMVVILGLLEC